jgi:hypothetical protein
MRPWPNLLPQNSTPLEVAFNEVAQEATLGLPVPLRQLWRPYEIDESLLPYLAWAMSVDLWDESWPIEKRRWVVATEIERHRRKGTLWAIDAYIRIAGGSLLRATVPPSATFLSKVYTEEQRREFLALFPQLRVRPYAPVGPVGPLAFLGHTYPGPSTKCFPRQTVSARGYRRDAVMWDRGVETPLTWRERRTETYSGVETVFDEIVLPARASGQLFLDAPPKSRMFMGPPGAPERIVTLSVNRTYEYTIGAAAYRTVVPGLTPIHVDPVLTFDRGRAHPGAMFAGLPLRKRYLIPSSAWRRVYECFYLHDPERSPRKRGGWAFLGHTRLGIAPYTAELDVRMRRKLPKARAWRYVRGWVLGEDRSAISRICEAAVAGKALRDKVLVQFRTVRPALPSDNIPIGSPIGALIRS